MADSIVRLRIDSQEYDAKLKKAGDALNRYFETVRRGGGTLEYLDEGVLDAVKAIGSMTTSASSARGKVGELTKAFTDLHVQYQQFTDAEKESPIGKEMAQSLDQLKTRIEETKGQLSQANAEIGNTGAESEKAGSLIDSLTNRFGLNIKQLSGWGAAMAAGTAALKVAKDAFMANESAVDEWGRIVDSSKSLYEGFLNALNNGDISGYLSRIDQIVQAARQAYDELDRLGTMKTIQATQISPQMTENERMRQMIQTRRYIAPVDGRRASMANGTVLSDAQVRSLEQKLQNGMQKVVDLLGNEVKQAGRAIDAVYRRQGAELGMSVKEFRKGTSSMAEFEKRLRGAEMYNQWQQQNSYVDQSTGRMVTPRGNPYAAYKGWDVFRVDGDRFKDLVKLIQQRDQQAAQAYGLQTQAFRTINRAEGITARVGGTSGGGGGRSGTATTKIPKVEEVIPVGSVAALNKELQDLRKQQELATDTTAWQDYQAKIDELTSKVKILKGQIADPGKMQKGVGASVLGMAIGQEQLNNVESQLKALLPEGGIKIPAKLEINTGNTQQQSKEMAKDWQQAASAIQSVGSAMQQIEDPAVKVAGTVAQAVATIALAYAEASAMAAKTTGPWGWIAFAATGLATMLTTISSIKSATKGFAEGGIINGRSMSGDNNIIGVNDGEVILNRAQQGNIASQLSSERESGAYRPSYISGEQIYLALNRYTRRTGRGEIVTWK